MQITIRHTLKLGIADPIPRLLLHTLLTPQTGPGQRVLDWTVGLSTSAQTVPLVDGFGNKVLFASLAGVDGPIEITVSGTVETLGGNGVLGWPMGEPVPWLFHRVTPSTRIPASIWGRFRGEVGQQSGQLGAMHGLMARIRDVLDTTAGEQNQAQSGDGATQRQWQGGQDAQVRPAADYAETFVGSARALGIPARFVSGYVLSDEPGVESGPHQWAEAYVEGLGWIGFDPRLDVCPTDRHVRLAVGFDALTAAPVRAYPTVGDGAIPLETSEILVAEDAGR
jgi:transglutaminase-like putative cysteine protease